LFKPTSGHGRPQRPEVVPRPNNANTNYTMQIESRIRQFILQNLYFLEDNALDDDASFLKTGVVDSMGVTELVAFVEAEWRVSIKPHELVVENFDSVRKVARFIRGKLSLPEQQGSSLGTASGSAGSQPSPLAGR
jgi:acyl carrier protein